MSSERTVWSSPSSVGHVRRSVGISGVLRRPLGDAPERLGELSESSREPPGERTPSRAILGGSATDESENYEMQENDDPYATFAMFSTSRGLLNDTRMLPETHFSDVRVRTRAEGVSGSVVGASRELRDGVSDGQMAKSRTTVDLF